MRMPEEINRVITDCVSALLLCPTEQAVRNLLAEGYQTLGSRIERIGDVMLDAALFYRERASRPVGFTLKSSEPFAVVTVHRAENTDDPVRLRNILTALNELNTRIPVVLPLHPRARARLQAQALKAQFTILDPVGYLEMVWLLENCCRADRQRRLQKEAWFFHRPCVTLRDETEWVELLEVEALAWPAPTPREFAQLRKQLSRAPRTTTATITARATRRCAPSGRWSVNSLAALRAVRSAEETGVRVQTTAAST